MYQNIFMDDDKIWLWDDKRGLVMFSVDEYNYAYKKDPNGKYKSFTGERCTKVSKFNKSNPDIFEGDLPMETRVLTDIYLNEDNPSEGHRLVFFDIEVSTEDGLPDTETTLNPITSIALYDDVTNEYTVFLLKPSSDVDVSVSLEDVRVLFFDDEIDLLLKFLDVWEQINPTIVSGWNSDHFDVPYLFRRINKLLGWQNATRLSTVNRVKFSKYRQKYQIAGVSSLDYLDMYKKFTYTELPNYRLGTVGKEEVGIDKIEYEGTLDELYFNDTKKFIEYNLTDVKILVELEKKMKLIELVRGICHVGHVQYEDYGYSSRFLEGTIVTFLHRKGLVVTNRAPNAREMMNERGDDEAFAGAYVKDPYPALYEWVYSLDLQSLYPSIIMSLNISPETKVAKVVGSWDMQKYVDDQLESVIVQTGGDNIKLSGEDLKKFVKEQDLCISSNGVLYRMDKKGVIPEVLETWFEDRVKYKNLRDKFAEEGDNEKSDFYDRRQHIQKIFLNSLYGVLGLPIFRFFDIDNALAVTATGQDVIKNSEKYVNKMYEVAGAQPKPSSWIERYWIVVKKDAKDKKKSIPPKPDPKDWGVYIDTDSLYFSSMPLWEVNKNINLDQEQFTVQLAKHIGNKLNQYYNQMALDWFNCRNHRLYIKGETVATRGIWTAKKRYALMKTYDLETDTKLESGKLVVKGLDIVRSTFPTAFKEYMRLFIVDVLNGVDKNSADQSLMNFIEDMKSSHYSLVARNTGVKNISKYFNVSNHMGQYNTGTPAHVKAAINYNHLLSEFGIDNQWPPISDGDKVKYIYLTNNPYHLDSLAFKDYEDPPEIQNFLHQYADKQTMFDKEMKNKLSDFYQALGWGDLPTERSVSSDVMGIFGL